jgi:4-amino-4-deoxychorismate lyase
MSETIDRWQHYGDGVFETLRVVDGHAPLIDFHFDRLIGGAAALGLPSPVRQVLEDAVERCGQGAATLKVIYGAAPSGRGYARQPDMPGRWQRYQWPWAAGVDKLHVRLCATRLSWQPRLAGIKHLNRLDQVLARAEWRDEWDEGLMLNRHDQLQCAVAGNVLIHLGRWLTPAIAGSGVAGVARRWLMERFDIEECDIDPADIGRCGGLVICNAIHGPRAVAGCDGHVLPQHPDVDRWRAQWAALFS